jgi:hypothetical protein
MELAFQDCKTHGYGGMVENLPKIFDVHHW